MYVCMYVCMSGYAFSRALMSHADILDSGRGHIFRKYRRKNNKKITQFYEKTTKNRLFLRTFSAEYLLIVKAIAFTRIPRAICVHAVYLRISDALSPHSELYKL